MSVAPRYSVLLPTRNGGEQVEGAIRSVLESPREDFELVVSDNASTDATPDILAGFADDPRLVAVRQTGGLDVTENWNACLELSRGERIMLIGDDDRLLPGYFERADELIERWGSPDVLTYGAVAYAAPGFVEGSAAHYADPCWEVANDLPDDGMFTPGLRQGVIADQFRFRFPFLLNMQTALVTREAIGRLRAGVFKRPFPDFYGLTALMLVADRWALSSERLVIIGVSPKSFGRTIHTPEKQAGGNAYLGIAPSFTGGLPGSEIFNGHVETLLALLADYPDLLQGTKIDRREYVISQANTWWTQYRVGTLPGQEAASRLGLLGRRDWLLLAEALLPRLRPAAVARQLRAGTGDPVQELWPGMRPVPEAGDLDEFRAWFAGRDARDAVSVAAVVLSYDGRHLLEIALPSLAAQTLADVHVLVVDNGSSDGTGEWLAAEWPQVEVIALPANVGVTAALNVGLRAAHGHEFIALLNNDIELEPTCLEQLVGALREFPEAGSAGTKLLDFYQRDVLDGTGDFLRWTGTATRRGHGERDTGRYDTPEAVFGACGGAALYRSAALDDVGLLDETFFAFSEDVDWALRAQLAGWGCRYVPTAVVYHMGSATLGRGLTEFTAYHLWRNGIWMIAKDFPLSALVRRAPLIAFGFALNLAAAWWDGKLDVWSRAMRDAARGLPGALKRRRAVQRKRRRSLAELDAVISR